MPYSTSACAVNVPAELANTYVWPAGSVVLAGTVARALAVPALLEPHSVQPLMSIVAAVVLRISTTSSLPPPGPPNAACEITTPVAACAAGATPSLAIASNTAAVAARTRNFTVQESFPRGNPKDGGKPIVAPDGWVTVP